MVMEILVNGNGHIVTDAEDCTKRIGTEAQVGVLTHILKALSLLLHGVVTRTGTQYLYLGRMDLTGLTGCGALAELTLDTEARARRNLLEELFVKLVCVGNYLHIVDGRAVIECNKMYNLACAMGTYPTLGHNSLAIVLRLEDINYLCAFHIDI